MDRSREEIEADLNNIKKQIEALEAVSKSIGNAKSDYNSVYMRIGEKWTDDGNGARSAMDKKEAEIEKAIDDEAKKVAMIASTLASIANNIRQNELKHS